MLPLLPASICTRKSIYTYMQTAAELTFVPHLHVDFLVQTEPNQVEWLLHWDHLHLQNKNHRTPKRALCIEPHFTVMIRFDRYLPVPPRPFCSANSIDKKAAKILFIRLQPHLCRAAISFVALLCVRLCECVCEQAKLTSCGGLGESACGARACERTITRVPLLSHNYHAHRVVPNEPIRPYRAHTHTHARTLHAHNLSALTARTTQNDQTSKNNSRAIRWLHIPRLHGSAHHYDIKTFGNVPAVVNTPANVNNSCAFAAAQCYANVYSFLEICLLRLESYFSPASRIGRP